MLGFFIFCVGIMNREQHKELIDVIEAKIAPLGYECVEIEWDAVEATLRIFIDKPEGVKMDDCLRVNDVLIDALELDERLPEDYRLEISSPGIEKPLRTKFHFLQVVGQTIKVRLSERTENRKEGVGKLLGIDHQDIVSLELPAGVWNFPFQVICRANLVYEW
jgi:ribosome maturation factor RimP